MRNMVYLVKVASIFKCFASVISYNLLDLKFHRVEILSKRGWIHMLYGQAVCLYGFSNRLIQFSDFNWKLNSESKCKLTPKKAATELPLFKCIPLYQHYSNGCTLLNKMPTRSKLYDF